MLKLRDENAARRRGAVLTADRSRGHRRIPPHQRPALRHVLWQRSGARHRVLRGRDRRRAARPLDLPAVCRSEPAAAADSMWARTRPGATIRTELAKRAAGGRRARGSDRVAGSAARLATIPSVRAGRAPFAGRGGCISARPSGPRRIAPPSASSSGTGASRVLQKDRPTRRVSWYEGRHIEHTRTHRAGRPDLGGGGLPGRARRIGRRRGDHPRHGVAARHRPALRHGRHADLGNRHLIRRGPPRTCAKASRTSALACSWRSPLL